jgi:hypothetical protein
LKRLAKLSQQTAANPFASLVNAAPTSLAIGSVKVPVQQQSANVTDSGAIGKKSNADLVTDSGATGKKSVTGKPNADSSVSGKISDAELVASSLSNVMQVRLGNGPAEYAVLTALAAELRESGSDLGCMYLIV